MIYTSSFNEDKILSDSICEGIKSKLQGEWFVFVSDANQKNLNFNISTVSQNDLLIIRLGQTRFQIAKIK